MVNLVSLCSIPAKVASSTSLMVVSETDSSETEMLARSQEGRWERPCMEEREREWRGCCTRPNTLVVSSREALEIGGGEKLGEQIR